jgi:hypothetical protein
VAYDIGDAVPLTYTLSAAATVTLTVTAPDGTTSNPTLTEGGSPPAVTYTAAVAATQAGVWLYAFAATGAVTDAEDGSFFVNADADARVYATRPELKQRMGIPAADVVDNDEIDRAILSASRSIDQDCQRHFWKLTETRSLCPTGPYLLKLGAFNDLVSVTTLKTDVAGDGTWETTWQASDYQLLCADGTPNVNAAPEPRPYTQIRAVGAQTFPGGAGHGTRSDLVQIAGVWGWPSVPADVREAAMIAAAELFSLKDTKFGATGVGDLGIVVVRENRQVQRLIAPYKRFAVLAA